MVGSKKPGPCPPQAGEGQCPPLLDQHAKGTPNFGVHRGGEAGSCLCWHWGEASVLCSRIKTPGLHQILSFVALPYRWGEKPV